MKKVIVWGAFGVDELDVGANSSKMLGEYFENCQNYEILFWVDNAERKWGKSLLGRKVYHPEKILEYPEYPVLINSLSFVEIKDQIMQIGGVNPIKVVPFYWYSGTPAYPYDRSYAKEHWESFGSKIKELFDTDDDETCRQLQVIERLRSSGKDKLYDYDEYFQTGKKVSYFCDKVLSPSGDVTFFDIGAYRGESIEPVRIFYKDRLKKVYAFEPDEENRSVLAHYIDGKSEIRQISKIYEYALSDENTITHFSSNRGASAISDTGDLSVECKRFDSMDEFEIYGNPMLKMDIEGAELNALKGMKKFIQKYEPYLAICLYHKVSDLYDIPSYLHELCPTYRLFFRGGYHLECWAVPKRHFS